MKNIKLFIRNITPFLKLYVSPYKRYYIEATLTLFLINMLGLLEPFLSKLIFDEAIIGRDMRLFVILLVFSNFSSLFIIFGTTARNYIYDFLSGKVNFEVNVDYLYHIMKLPLKFYDRRRVGEIIQRVNDSGVVQEFINLLLFELVENIFLVTINLAACIYLSPLLTLIILLFFPLYALYSVVVGRLTRKYEEEKWERDKVISSEMNEAIFGMRIIKAFSGESKVFRKLKLLYLQFREYNLRYQRKFIALRMVYSIFQNGESFVIFLLGGMFMINGEMTIGEWLAFQAVSTRVFTPLKSLIGINKKLQNQYITLERFCTISGEEQERHSAPENLTVKRGKIEFRELNFSYRENKRVLNNINLTIEPGQTVALVGRSGSGKTTMANLIAKFYLPDSGKLLIDGQDILDYDVKSLRNDMGIVLQESYIFYGTVLENLLLAAPGKSREQAIEACRLANAHDFIMELPEGYDTKIGEQGLSFSGGEKQRISIAQAILKNPAILILDEATSHLDLETEERVQDAIGKLIADRTAVVIAHRLSTIHNADMICVINDGEIVETGSHESLINSDSYYRKLYMRTANI